MNKPLSLVFDISQASSGKFSEHYSDYMSETGSLLEAYEVLSGYGVYLMHGNITHHNIDTIEVTAVQDYVHFVFVLETSRTYTVDHREECRFAVSQLYQMAYFVKSGSILSFEFEANKATSVFEISIAAPLLFSMLPEGHFLYHKLQGFDNFQESVTLFDKPMEISPTLKALLYQMIYCQYTDVAKQLYIKGKVMELLALQQVRFGKIQKGKDIDAILSEDEKEKVMCVRNLLVADPNRKITLATLAREVGTNECYLKQNFKLLFGTTVFGYIKQLKMEQAKKLLLKNKNVSEVAQMVGYKHAQHFTTAFKKHFGYVPNKLQ